MISIWHLCVLMRQGRVEGDHSTWPWYAGWAPTLVVRFVCYYKNRKNVTREHDFDLFDAKNVLQLSQGLRGRHDAHRFSIRRFLHGYFGRISSYDPIGTILGISG